MLYSNGSIPFSDTEETGETNFISTSTGNLVKKIENAVVFYNNFYIECANEDDSEFKLLDSDLNTVATSVEEPTFYGNNIFVMSNQKDLIYYYDNKNLKLLDEAVLYTFRNIGLRNNVLKDIGESVYAKVGIINYYYEE